MYLLLQYNANIHATDSQGYEVDLYGHTSTIIMMFMAVIGIVHFTWRRGRTVLKL